MRVSPVLFDVSEYFRFYNDVLPSHLFDTFLLPQGSLRHLTLLTPSCLSASKGTEAVRGTGGDNSNTSDEDRRNSSTQATCTNTHKKLLPPREKTTMDAFRLLLLSSYFLIPRVQAWGSLYEPQRAFGLSSSSSRTTRLEARQEPEDEDASEVFSKEEHTLESDETLFNTLSSSFFAPFPDLWEDMLLDDIEGLEYEDEECSIPDSWKSMADESDIDVLAYLGLKRSDPIVAEVYTEWE